MKKGNFIVFEGIDGCGKTTQISLLRERLINEYPNLKVSFTREHTNNVIGGIINAGVNKQIDVDKKTLALLYAADRLDHVLNPLYGMLNTLNDGVSIVCDRYYLSSYAYQMVDSDLEWIKQINKQATEILKPDLTIILDVSTESVMKRFDNRGEPKTIFEKKSFLEKVSDNYKYLVESLPLTGENVEVLNGELSPEKLSDTIFELVSPYLL